MDPKEQRSTYLSRLAALGLLRENMLYADPKTYGYTDIAEDLPGKARAVAPILKNVLPSAAIISSDPEKRKQQIEQAAAKIKETQGDKPDISGAMWRNVKHLTPEALKAGTILGALIPLLGFRKPWKANASGKIKFQSPTDLGNNIKNVLNSGKYRKELAEHALEGGLFSATNAAAAGALLPLVSGNINVSDAALEDAKKIMQEQPQLTSLPGAEMVSALKEDNSRGNEIAKRIGHGLFGAGMGSLAAIPHSVIPAGISTLGLLAKNIIGRRTTGRPVTEGLKDLFLKQTKINMPTALRWGAGLGGLAGALAKPLPNDQEQSATSDQA